MLGQRYNTTNTTASKVVMIVKVVVVLALERNAKCQVQSFSFSAMHDQAWQHRQVWCTTARAEQGQK